MHAVSLRSSFVAVSFVDYQLAGIDLGREPRSAELWPNHACAAHVCEKAG